MGPLVVLSLFLAVAAPAAAAPIRLTPASGVAGAPATLAAGNLPPNSPVEVRVGARPVRILHADAAGRLTTRPRMRGARGGRVRIALKDARGNHVVLHYDVRSRWSGTKSASGGDWRGRVLGFAADLRRGKLVARTRLRGLPPGRTLAIRFGGEVITHVRADESGRTRGRIVLPQTATGRQVVASGGGVRLAVTVPAPPPTIVATADIACKAPYETTEQGCRHAETARLAAGHEPDAVILAGDVQYQEGSMSEFRASFHRTWGQLDAPLRPTPGNHEYRTPGARGFYDYFEWQSGWRPPEWYAFDVGGWRLIALNSNCEPDRVECHPGSEQEQWLRATLSTEPHRCTLAYWHHPRYSSGFHGSDVHVDPFWQALDEAGAELVVGGHDHHYERFAPQDARGQFDELGMRQFVVGTGGNYPSVVRSPRAPHSAYAQNRHFGVLVLRLYDDAYSWRFVALGGRVLDYGVASCV